jgi:hypothetical protein
MQACKCMFCAYLANDFITGGGGGGFAQRVRVPLRSYSAAALQWPCSSRASVAPFNSICGHKKGAAEQLHQQVRRSHFFVEVQFIFISLCGSRSPLLDQREGRCRSSSFIVLGPEGPTPNFQRTKTPLACCNLQWDWRRYTAQCLRAPALCSVALKTSALRKYLTWCWCWCYRALVLGTSSKQAKI